MKKRLLAAFLSLIMVVSLLPLAVTADAVPDTDVKIGHYEDGKWVDGEPNHSSLPDGVKTVSKTAVKKGENQYDVTLEVVLETTETQSAASAATVLVMDTSTSMSLCSQCGEELGNRHRPHPAYSEVYNIQTYGRYYVLVGDNYKEVTYCDGEHSHFLWTEKCSGGAGWYTSTSQNSHTAGNKLTPKTSATSGGVRFYTRSNTADLSRMDVAKEAAVEFLKAYSGFEETSFNTDGSLKSGTADKNIGRYVAVVEFGTIGKISQNWVDASTRDGYNRAYRSITKISVPRNNGTNIDAGLRFADYLFDQRNVSGIELKNTILLTDGEPTFYLNQKSYNSEDDVKIGNTTYYAHGGGNYCNQATYDATINTADTLKNRGEVSLYTVCFGVADQKMAKDAYGSYITERWDVTVGDYLKNSIATTATADNTYAYNANNTDELVGAFKAITSSIVSGISAGTVTDSLPNGITAKVDFAKTWELKPEDAEVTTVGNKTTYTYKKTYTVTIDPETVEIDENGYTPLNSETTLTVGETQIQFPIPAGKVTQKEYTLTYIVDGVQNGSTEDHIANASFTLRTITVPTGYHFDGWYTDETMTIEADDPFTMPAENTTLYGKIVANGDTKYTVKHMIQDLNSGVFTVSGNIEEYEGKTGETIDYEKRIKDIPGFTFSLKDSFTESSGVGDDVFTPTVLGDGSRIIYLCYTRNSYKVAYEYKNDVPAGASTLFAERHYKFGEEVTVENDAEAPGFNFSGWDTNDVEVTNGKFTMPAKNVTFSGEFTLEEQWTEPKITLLIPFEKKITVSPGSQTPAPASFKFKIEVAGGLGGFKFTFVPEEGDKIPVDDDGTFTIPNVDGDINGSIRVVGTVEQFAAIRRAPNEDKTNWSLRMTEIDGGSDGWTYDSSEQLFFFAGTTFLRTESGGIVIEKNFDPINLTEVSKLRIRYFVGDTKLADADANQLELTSSGKPDEKEDHWTPLNGAQNGWNLIEPTLPGTHDPEDYGADLAAVNFFRMFVLYKGAPIGNNTIYIDSVSYMKNGVMHYIISPEEARNAAHNLYNGEQKFVFKNTYNKPEEITVTVPLVKKTLTTDMSIKDEKFEYEVFFVFENLEAGEKPFRAELYDQHNQITTYPTIEKLTDEDIKKLGYGEETIAQRKLTAYSVKANVGIGFGEGTYFNYLNIIGQESVLKKVIFMKFKENLTEEQIAKDWKNNKSFQISVTLPNGDGSGITYDGYAVTGLLKGSEANKTNNYFAVNTIIGSPFVMFAAENEIKHEEPEITVKLPFIKFVDVKAGSEALGEDTLNFTLKFELKNPITTDIIPFIVKNGEDVLTLKFDSEKNVVSTDFVIKVSDAIDKYTVVFDVIGKEDYLKDAFNFIEVKENLTEEQKNYYTVSDNVWVNYFDGFTKNGNVDIPNRVYDGPTTSKLPITGLSNAYGKTYFATSYYGTEDELVLALENTYNKAPVPADNDKKVTLPHWVTLKYMNGNDQLKRKAYIYDDLAKLNFVPTREGYTFTGWYTDSSCTVKITQIRMKGDIKVYAGWEKNEK